MKNNSVQRYYSYRLRREKIKREIWLLVVVARLALFLTAVIQYLGRS